MDKRVKLIDYYTTGVRPDKLGLLELVLAHLSNIAAEFGVCSAYQGALIEPLSVNGDLNKRV